jgi:acetylornithine deacetylase/succinyl-diaminopimelate desuccinylase-like protein
MARRMNSVERHLRDNRTRHLDELTQFLAIPSVSALPQHREDVRRCAEWIADALRHAGLEGVTVEATPGHPIVYGEWLHAPGAPTVLCYGHYDVQPADPLPQWASPPFTATVRDGRLYARGASDDKGQLYIHVKAIEAWLAQAGHLPVNLKFIIEGEEEIGGESLVSFVRDHTGRLAADVAIDSDSAMFAPGLPSITYALRGLVYLQIDLRGAAADLHSGSFGGAVPNPAGVLAGMLGRLKDGDGRITIPGFYDEVRELTGEERAAFARLPFTDEAYRTTLGVLQLDGERGYSTLERIWVRPTLDVNGLHAGYTGDGAKTVIPATAMAKISMRLVPDQRAEIIAARTEAFLAAIAPPSVELTVTRLNASDPWITGTESPFFEAAARAFEHGFGTRPVFTREGGSNPITSVFQQVLGIPTLMFGIGLPTDNPHAPNEHLAVEDFYRGIVAAARLYEEIGRLRENAQTTAGPRSVVPGA